MTSKSAESARCAVIVGPYTSGKTTLMEALLHAAGAIRRKGSITEGNTVGDASAEARDRLMGVEANFAHCEYLGERWFFIDCPGSIELAYESHSALMAADVAIVVIPPEVDRVLAMAPLFKFLDDYQIPHLLFIGKTDKATTRVRDVMEALQSISSRPLLLRQVPIRDGDRITGFVDLVSERAYRYKEGGPSDLIEIPEDIKSREGEARQELLESLADFDDDLLEQLLEDRVPGSDEVYTQLSKDLAEDLIVPVFMGSGEHGNGVTRLFKALRHDVPPASVAATRMGIPMNGGLSASVIKTINQQHTGKLSVARIWRGEVAEAAMIGEVKPSGLYRLMGGESQKIASAGEGELVAFGRLQDAKTGDLLTLAGPVQNDDLLWPEVPRPVYALAITPRNRQDDVKLSASIARLMEEDPTLSVQHNHDTHQMLLWGQGEIHLKIVIERLKSRYNVEVDSLPPQTAYKETIKRPIKQHSRFKRQSGGHGQFGDVQVEIKPLRRGEGFEFVDKVVGGSVPRQYISAVEAGAKEYLNRGPLGFPVVDVSVTLVDGQHHAVDSSDQAFKSAARLAMSEGLPQCSPVLLEPIYEVVISVPAEFTARVHGLVSSRRGQILGFEAKSGWQSWDEFKCHMPQAELHDLIIELRSLTIGVGSFEWQFDHLQELTGKLADRVMESQQAEH